MELEELKNLWEGMSDRLQQQEQHTKKLLEEITEHKYQSKLRMVKTSETLGAVICFLGALYLILNFPKIEPLAEQIFAILAIVLLFSLPVISLMGLKAMQRLPVSSKTYLETVTSFRKSRVQFIRFQRLTVSFGLFLLVISIPVLASIKGIDLSTTEHFWTLTFPMGIVAFCVFAFWVLKSYTKSLKAAEQLLSEINN